MLGAHGHAVLAPAPDEGAVGLLVRLEREPREEVGRGAHRAEDHQGPEDEEADSEPDREDRCGRAGDGRADTSIDDGP